MVFDYSAGGLIPKHDKSNFLLAMKNNSCTANVFSSRAVSGDRNETFSARWCEDNGPIGQAIRDGKFNIILSAIRSVKQSRLR